MINEQLDYPATCGLTQSFGANYNPSYSQDGLKGHTGTDVNCGYGTDILSPYDGYVYKILAPNANYDYTAVFILVDDGIQCFEFSCGHMSEISVREGDTVVKGQSLGKEGNYGKTYSWDTEITAEMKRNGDHRATHRHYQQRPVEKLSSIAIGANQYLTKLDGGLFIKGFYYRIWDYNNGYHGCRDITLPIFTENLYFGVKGYEVYCLQRKIGVDATGYFGNKTLKAVKDYQQKNGISPTFGFVGSKTRALLNTMV